MRSLIIDRYFAQRPLHEADARAGPYSALRFAAIFSSATALGLLGQVAWLVGASRAMPPGAFGTVLAAQALYAVLQFVVDNGTAFHGARLAAARTLDLHLRASIIRLRLQLAVLSAAAALIVGAVGGPQSLLAVTPFVPALILFALFPYWERFGLGDSRPWSAYAVLRSAGPALTVVVVLLMSARFPLFLAGIVECGVILTVALAFRFRLLADLLAAIAAARGPWLSALRVSLPATVWMTGLASGTVVLSAFGAPAAAATFAVAVRLLTGVTQLAGTVATSLYPQLASQTGDPEAAAYARVDGTAGVDVALRVILCIAAVAFGVVLAVPALVVRALLDRADPVDEAAAIITISASAATSFLVLVTMVLIARHLEARILRPYLIGNGLIGVAAVAVALWASSGKPVWMAIGFLVGQLVCVVLLARRASASLPALRGSLRTGTVAAVSFAAGGVLAVTTDTLRVLVLVALAGTWPVLFRSTWSHIRRSLGEPKI